MRILKALVIILLALILIFLSIGLFLPSFDYAVSIEVKASPEKCWLTFHDTTRMSQWLPGFESLVLKSGEPLKAGSQYEIIVIDHNEKIVMSEIITKVNAPTSISYELNNDVLKSEYTFSFTGDSITTTIDSHYKVTGNNVMWKSILFLSKSYLESNGQEQLAGLKKVVEMQL